MTRKKIISKSKPFILGFCQCGCGTEIPLRSDKGFLRRYVNHHSSIKYKRKLIECECGCKELLWNRDKHYEKRRFIRGHATKGERNWQYKNGTSKSNKYILKSNKDHPKADSRGYVREHRLVWETHYNCCLVPWYHIHHKDKNPENNNIKNLEPILSPEHTRLHHTKDMSDRFCLICHSKTTGMYRKKKHHTLRPRWYKFKNGFECSVCYLKVMRKKMCLLHL